MRVHEQPPQIGIPGQGGNGLVRVAPDNVGDMVLEPGEARPDPSIEHIYAGLQVFPQTLDRIEFGALGGEPQ